MHHGKGSNSGTVESEGIKVPLPNGLYHTLTASGPAGKHTNQERGPSWHQTQGAENRGQEGGLRRKAEKHSKKEGSEWQIGWNRNLRPPETWAFRNYGLQKLPDLQKGEGVSTAGKTAGQSRGILQLDNSTGTPRKKPEHLSLSLIHI